MRASGGRWPSKTKHGRHINDGKSFSFNAVARLENDSRLSSRLATGPFWPSAARLDGANALAAVEVIPLLTALSHRDGFRTAKAKRRFCASRMGGDDRVCGFAGGITFSLWNIELRVWNIFLNIRISI
jgi:hypothetical protein